MRAEDTVISEGTVVKGGQMVVFQDHKILEYQAKISFKAGYNQRKAEELPYYNEERLAGIREVVEWLEANALGTHSTAFSVLIAKWQAKLKEWGIEL